MPGARILVAALVAAVCLGSALTLAVVDAAGGFDAKTVEIRTVPASSDPPLAATAKAAPGYVSAIYRAHVRSVVTVLVDTGTGEVQTSGSGFVADARRGFIVTASHVVTSSGEAKDPRKVQRFGRVFVMRFDGARAPATIVGYDLFDDVAVLHYDPDLLRLPAAPLGDSATVHVGDPVAAIGAPWGQVESISAGVVSQIGTQIVAPAAVCFRTTDALQTDAAINPGNSGGPLFDASGKVIGVNSQIDTPGPGGGGTGVAFAVPINAARRSLAEIVKSGHVSYAWLGVGAITLTSDIAKALQLRATSGAQVTFVEPRSAAATAGITPGSGATSINGRTVHTEADVIVAFDGKPVRTLQDLQHAVAAKRPGDRVTVAWWHDGTRRSTPIVLGARTATDPDVCRASSAP
jgi:S1-C subfamily serine protease